MELIPIEEFLQLAQLKSDELVGLLGLGKLRFSSGDGGELLIDITSYDPESYVRPLSASCTEPSNAALEEEIAAQILGILGEVLDDAFDLALTWLKSTQNDEG